MEREDRRILLLEVRAALKNKATADVELAELLSRLPTDSDKACGLRAKIRDRLGE